MSKCDGRSLHCTVGETWTLEKDVAENERHKADEILAG